jgi:hypothetical protein
MRITHLRILSAIALASITMAKAQGTFQNLNFEEANIVPIAGSPYYPYAITVANALPGWTVDYGSAQQTQILYNDPSLGDTAVTLYANGYPGSPVPVIDGNFSVLLQGGLLNGVTTAASISQTGLIPSGTQSLLFDVGSPTFPPSPPQVSIGNQELSLFPVGSVGNYTIFGGNISEWAGQTEQLTFSSSFQNFLIDDISFSTQAVPEPSPLALTGVGGLLFALYRRLAPKRK